MNQEIPENENDATEMKHLRIRLIAVENLLIAVLADGPDKQLDLAREMSNYISPREGATEHPLTIHAAEHMNDIVARAVQYRRKQR